MITLIGGQNWEINTWPNLNYFPIIVGGDGPGLGATGVDRQDSFMDELDHFQKMLDEDDLSDGQARSRYESLIF